MCKYLAVYVPARVFQPAASQPKTGDGDGEEAEAGEAGQ